MPSPGVTDTPIASVLQDVFQRTIREQINTLADSHLEIWKTTPTDIYRRMRIEATQDELDHPGFPGSVRELSNFHGLLSDAARAEGWIYSYTTSTVDLVRMANWKPLSDEPEPIPAPPTAPTQQILPGRGPNGFPYMAYEYGLSQHGLPVFRFLPYNSVPIPSERWFEFLDILNECFGVPKLQRSESLKVVPQHVFDAEGWAGVHRRIEQALGMFERDPWPLHKDGLQGPGV